MTCSWFLQALLSVHIRTKQLYIYIYTYIHIYIHTYIHIYIYIYKHACIRLRTSAYKDICYMYILNIDIDIDIDTDTDLEVYTYVDMGGFYLRCMDVGMFVCWFVRMPSIPGGKHRGSDMTRTRLQSAQGCRELAEGCGEDLDIRTGSPKPQNLKVKLWG